MKTHPQNSLILRSTEPLRGMPLEVTVNIQPRRQKSDTSESRQLPVIHNNGFADGRPNKTLRGLVHYLKRHEKENQMVFVLIAGSHSLAYEKFDYCAFSRELLTDIGIS